MIKINFKQPKYIFPAIIFIPLSCLAYYVCGMFEGNSSETVATDQINANLPDAALNESADKLTSMQSRFDDEDAYSAVNRLGDEQEEKEGIEHGYSEEELNRIDAEEAERTRRETERLEMERQLAESRKHINSYAGGGNYGYSGDDDYYNQMDEIQRRSIARQKMIDEVYGYNNSDKEDVLKQRRQDSIAAAKAAERERNRPNLVLKSRDTNIEKFNTVVNEEDRADAPLIRAMIDKTTKAHEGTRIRFKLLDHITVKGIHIPKGTYLYGTVTGFGQQRVKASITSILVGSKFININLSVFDNDGMEGFYVPESAFRDFMKEAGAAAIQQNMNFTSDTGYGGINGEAIALQALQNIYNSATNAISANIRKNRAKIKYNTIVYLINSDDAK